MIRIDLEKALDLLEEGDVTPAGRADVFLTCVRTLVQSGEKDLLCSAVSIR